ncbi:hypothetical protein WISP_102429 [Willisornis vidua]|uniref:Uncharacterized protein n=1 Tax=Willisornis vidua TaxID=1566151 RepID=A0ABQ9D3H8_9PASS|nr:hypothetical protein WISP_102429 [Willisornis vidua]
MLKEFMKGCLPWQDLQAKSVKSSSPEEEELAEKTCDEQTAPPIPSPCVLLGDEKVEKIGNKVKPKKEAGVGISEEEENVTPGEDGRRTRVQGLSGVVEGKRTARRQLPGNDKAGGS